MRILFLPSLLTVSLMLAGCAGTPPAELAMVEAQSKYDDRMLDALGQQRYTESQIIYNRQLSEYEERLEELERKRQGLESALTASAYEHDISDARPDSAESKRIGDFQSATYAAQARAAQAAARAETRGAVIENNRDAALAELEGAAARRIAELERHNSSSGSLNEQRIVVAIANAESERRIATEIDELTTKVETLKANNRALVAAHEKQINERRLQISALEAEIIGIQSDVDNLTRRETAALRPHTSRLEVLYKEAAKLAEISAKLISPEPSTKQNQTTDTAAAKADILAELANQKALITSKARLELAETSTHAVLEAATVVAPVVTGRKVYAGEFGVKPEPYAHTTPAPNRPRAESLVARQTVPAEKGRVSKPSAPTVNPVKGSDRVLVVDSFEPRPGITPTESERNTVGSVIITTSSASAGTAKPIVVAPSTRTTFNVVYQYSDKDSFDQFQRYLKAYGVTDTTATENPGRKEYTIWAGRYYTADEAARRVDQLNKTTSTSHASIIRQEVPR
ncbi:hypothetical protein QAO71_17730 (plasmid) [Halopseudomonas sp. SMJS2]|uniref:hypothetical protein n=1 Tax=Halopseudomonas sp. SMJS2 TaxID=3041098 RepID=UPI002453310E|nr:hypothetical protein [Halopseudomonas sp. SMJS2]WGK63382.1 hypothetical protein QAO71_17730 [Halopseudomonas sp. SMJS2]